MAGENGVASALKFSRVSHRNAGIGAGGHRKNRANKAGRVLRGGARQRVKCAPL
jgi:hypothetical protein